MNSNEYLLIDKHNENKAHHITFQDGKVIYNQAIRAEKLRNPRNRNSFEAHGSIWYDFYDAEIVEDSEFHGYREYISEARELLKKDIERADLSKCPFSLSEIKAAIAEARDQAKEIARGFYSHVRSRGANIGIYDNDSNEKLDEIEFKALRDIMKAIKATPDLKDLVIDGGFDGADSLKDLNEGCVEVWLSEWSLELISSGKWVAKLEPRAI